MPTFLSGTLHEHNLAIAGTISASIFLVAAATQLLFHGVSPVQAIQLGLGLLLAGLAFVELGLWSGVLAILIVGTVLGGLAVGFGFMGGTAAANILAPAEHRGQVLATFFCCTFAGLSGPALGVGIATDSVSVTSATLVCAIVIAAMAIAVMVPLATGRAHIESTI